MSFGPREPGDQSPIVVEDEDFETSEASTSTKATSVEPEVGPTQLPGSCSREPSPTHTCLNARLLTELSAEPCDRAISPGVALPQHGRRRTVLRDDQEAAATTRGSTQLKEEEWEITNNVELEQSNMEIHQPLSSRPPPAVEKEGGQGNWDEAKRADDQGHREEVRGKATVWENKGAETDDNGEGSPNDGDEKKPIVRSTRKRHLPATGRKFALGRRSKRHRFTSAHGV
ncbi:MAG: hypothetical protein Q9199_000171 [Rusavskia elegans]